jgi:hypothetical protein
MKSWAKWTAKTVLVTTGFAAAGGGLPGVAFAGTGGGPNIGNVSVLGGNQVNAPVSIPINLCGNAAAILGFATAGCQGGASVVGSPAGATDASGTSSNGGLTAGNISVVHGTVVKIPVEIAADACGNSVGNATAHCHGGVTLPGGTAGSAPRGNSPGQGGQSAGNLSVGSGNNVQVPVGVPVDVCGNAVAVLGNSSAGCVGGATVGDQSYPMGHGNPAAHVKAAHPKAARTAAKAGHVKGGPHKLATHPTAGQLAGLGALPGVASLPALGGLTATPLLKSLSGLTGGGALLPASALSAYQPGAGMSSTSFASLAIGALLAGAAALKLASRRVVSRKAGRGEEAA